MYQPQNIVNNRQVIPQNHGAAMPAAQMGAHDRSRAQQIVEDYLARAKSRAAMPIERIMSEVPRDNIIRGQALAFEPDGDTNNVRATMGGVGLAMHDNALGQVAQRLDMSMTAVRQLQERNAPWARNLLAHTLTEHARNVWTPSDRFLVRAVGTSMRGFLSDRFRRIDCRPVLDVLIGEAQRVGALVADAVVSDVRASVRFLMPRALEIAPGEFVALGMEWSNSDYGKGKNALSAFLMRVWCLNGAMLSQELAQIHLGGRLSDSIQYSRATIEADSRAATLAARDTARALLAPARIDATSDVLKTAATTTLDPKATIADLRKRLGKGLAEKIGQTYNTADVEALPPGNTAWRMSNAISWVAKQDDVDADTRVDLEREAGALLV